MSRATRPSCAIQTGTFGQSVQESFEWDLKYLQIVHPLHRNKEMLRFLGLNWNGSVNTSKTQYLIRFDDICPTMNWEVWDQIEVILRKRGIKPILAVVPDNQDSKLMIDAPRDDFWARVRQWQEWGWTIGLHGYQHKYVTTESGIVGVKNDSEFAGLPENEQKDKLRKAIAIFQRQNINPEIWVAPSHSFDAVTVSLLPTFGINIISDGIAFSPFYERNIIWVPVQLWRFRSIPMPTGVWTVCHHCNSWRENQLAAFSRDVDSRTESIHSLSDVLDRFSPRCRNLSDVFLAACILSIQRLKRITKSSSRK